MDKIEKYNHPGNALEDFSNRLNKIDPNDGNTIKTLDEKQIELEGFLFTCVEQYSQELLEYKYIFYISLYHSIL